MANKEQLQILRKGVKDWNRWRKDNPDVNINLQGANLRGLNLRGADLRDANFKNTDIRGTRFKNANLAQADFTGAKAGHTLLEACAQLVLAVLHGIMAGWFLFVAGTFCAAIFNAVFPHQGITPLLLFVLAGAACVFIGGTILGIRRGTVVTATARTRIVSALAVVTIASTLALTLAVLKVGLDVAALALIGTMIGGVAAALVVLWAGVGAMALVGAGVLAAVSAIASAVTGVLVVTELVFQGAVATIAVAVTVIVSVSTVCLYIAWRTRHEDAQFDLLHHVGLNLVTMFGTDFMEATLTGATFNEADLKYSRFVGAELDGVSWHKAQHLHLARFSETILIKHDVRNLLVDKNGYGGTFKGKNLHGANLVGANLSETDLRESELVQVNLSRADITGAKLYGSVREGWKIDDIQCEYVYWDKEGKQRTPPDRDFRPGEFEELHRQLPSFEYVFKQGFTSLEAMVMNRVVETINEQNPDFKLDLINFDKRGKPHATFTVQHNETLEADKQKEVVENAKQEVARNYEERIAALEGKQEQMMQLMSMMVNNPQKIELIMGNKQITAGNDYIENIEGDNFDSGGGNMNIAKDQGSATQTHDIAKSGER